MLKVWEGRRQGEGEARREHLVQEEDAIVAAKRAEEVEFAARVLAGNYFTRYDLLFLQTPFYWGVDDHGGDFAFQAAVHSRALVLQLEGASLADVEYGPVGDWHDPVEEARLTAEYGPRAH